jgi:hypothetical protein
MLTGALARLTGAGQHNHQGSASRSPMKRYLLFCLYVAPFLAAGCRSDTRQVPRGWYYAGSNLKDEKALGGFGPCDNFPKKIKDDLPGKPGELALIAFPDEIVDFRKRKAILLRLVNRTEKTVDFAACDSSLYIVQEALDSKGQWKALERFPETGCGNSFHRVFLEPDEFWEFFALPRAGSFKTRLRFRLELGGESGIAAGGSALYSNEYEGGIDPSAFVPDAEH